MKSTFSTQLPIHAPHIEPLQRRAGRNGAIRGRRWAYDGTGDGERSTARSTTRLTGRSIWGRRHGTRYQAVSRMSMPYIIETKNSPPLYTKDGEGSGTISGLRRLWRDEGVLLFVSLAVSLHASPAIASACLTTGGALPSRSPRLAWAVRRAGRRPVSSSIAPPRFPLSRFAYSAVFSVLPCLTASMSWRVRKPIAWPQSRQTSW